MRIKRCLCGQRRPADNDGSPFIDHAAGGRERAASFDQAAGSRPTGRHRDSNARPSASLPTRAHGRGSMPEQPRPSMPAVKDRRAASAPWGMQVQTADAGSEEVALFKTVLRELEICEENEVMSSTTASGSSTNAKALTSSTAVSLREPRPSLPMPPSQPLSREQLEDIFRRLRHRELPSPAAAAQLVQQVRDHLQENCQILVRLQLEQSGRVIVVGDLHGHFNDLLHLLDIYGEPCKANQYIFNGDFVDRGDWGPEVLIALLCLQLLHPDSVHLNRGNHEDPLCNENYGFRAQLMLAYPKHDALLYECIHEAFDELPLCYVVEKVFVVHGGLPIDYLTLADIESIPKGPVVRPPTCRADRIRESLLWSDPADVAGPNDRGSGCYFAEGDTKRFLMSNGLKTIVRSHECVESGFAYCHGERVLTVFSASNYDKVAGGNDACVILVTAEGAAPGTPWNVPYVKTDPDSPVKAEVMRGDPESAMRSRMDALEEWDGEDSQGYQAMLALQRRVSDVTCMKCPPQVRALGELRRMIFLARPSLLEAFEAADTERHGKVDASTWASVMATCLRTSKRFPWTSLGSYLYRGDASGQVGYVEFLSRLYSPLTQILADRWCDAMLVVLAERLGDDAGNEFDRLDRDGDGVVTYAELRCLIHQHLPMCGFEAFRQAAHVFALFRAMDCTGTGFVARAQFMTAIEVASKYKVQCHKGHALEEMVFRNWEGFVHTRECDSCGRHLQRQELRWHCVECDYDLCRNCYYSCFGLDQVEMNSLRAKGRPSLGGTKLQREWDQVEQAIMLLCRSRCDLRALCHLADVNNDGRIDRKEFVATISPLLNGDANLAAQIWKLASHHIRTVTDVMDTEKALFVAEIEKCLAIADTEHF